jgi:hypothetical protein
VELIGGTGGHRPDSLPQMSTDNARAVEVTDVTFDGLEVERQAN